MCDIQRLRQKISDLVNDKYQDYLVEPLKSVSSAAHTGAINTGDACACYVNFGVEVSGDDRDIEWIGLGLDLADVPNGTLFAMKQFSISALSGVAVRRKLDGPGVNIQVMHQASTEGEFVVPTDVLERFVERGVVATAYIGAVGFFTNLVDGGLQSRIAAKLSGEAFVQFRPLFEQYGIDSMFNPDNEDN